MPHACCRPRLPHCRGADSSRKARLGEASLLKAGDGPLLSAGRLEVDSELGEHLMPIQSLPSPRAAAARPRHAQTTMPFALAHAQTPASMGRGTGAATCVHWAWPPHAASIAALSPTLSWLPTAAHAARRRACRVTLQQVVPRCNKLCCAATGRVVLQQVVACCNWPCRNVLVPPVDGARPHSARAGGRTTQTRAAVPFEVGTRLGE